MNLFAVTALFGHVGRNKALIKTVPIISENGKNAAYVARWMPRVKHHLKLAILSVKKINEDEFNDLTNNIKNDYYFKAQNKKEQKINCGDMSDDIIVLNAKNVPDKNKRKNKIKFKMMKYKNIKKYALFQMRNYESNFIQGEN